MNKRQFLSLIGKPVVCHKTHHGVPKGTYGIVAHVYYEPPSCAAGMIGHYTDVEWYPRNSAAEYLTNVRVEYTSLVAPKGCTGFTEALLDYARVLS